MLEKTALKTIETMEWDLDTIKAILLKSNSLYDDDDFSSDEEKYGDALLNCFKQLKDMSYGLKELEDILNRLMAFIERNEEV